MLNADLRPMTIGEVLDRTFRLYKSEFWLFAGIMSFPFLIVFVGNVLFSWITTSNFAASRASTGFAQPVLLLESGAAAFLLVIVTFVVVGIGEAATIFAVSDIYLGRQATIAGSYGRVSGHIFQALTTIFLTVLAVIAGLLLLIVPGIILMCRMGLGVPVAMLEDEGAGTALSRSMELTKGFGMQMFVILLLYWVLSLGVGTVLTGPFTVLAMIPTPHVLPLGWSVLQHAAAFIAQVVVAPVQTIAFSLMYYNLRVRKEGFDLEHLIGSLGTPPIPNLPGTGEALPS